MAPDVQTKARRVALITGAAAGIGAECARTLAASGITVVGADVDDERGGRTFASLGEPHEYRHLDVGGAEQWRDVVAGIVSDHGRLDIVHLNAGVMARPKGVPLMDDPLEWFTPEAYRKVMTVNLDGVVLGIMAALTSPTVSRIVITASGAGVMPLALDPFYTASKFAAIGLAQALEPSLSKRGIRIDVICPGAIDTSITAPDVRAALKQESPSFIAESVLEILTTARPGPIWIALNAERGLERYEPPVLPGVAIGGGAFALIAPQQQS